jgi:hypothetical protein
MTSSVVDDKMSLLSAEVEDGICSLRFGGILQAPVIPGPIMVRKHLSFLAHAQKRALEDEVEVEVHRLPLVLQLGEVILREPYSVWDAVLSNDERGFRAFALSDQLPPIAIVSMMAPGAASLYISSGEEYDVDAEGGLQKGTDAPYQLDRALERSGPPQPGQV